MIRALIGTLETVVNDCSIVITQNGAGDVDMGITAVKMPTTDLLFKEVKLYMRERLLASGIILDHPNITMTNNVVEYQIRWMDELGKLTAKRAKTNSHYQDVPITTIISDLLSYTLDWALGDTSTMADSNAKTTIDLRGKESLFGQLIEVVRSVPSCFLRYGGYNSSTSKHEIEIGAFKAKRYYMTQGENLETLTIQMPAERQYKVIEAYGDLSSSEKVSLLDALNNPDTLADPLYANYPITFDATTGTYIVTRLDLTAGCERTTTYRMHKTKNDAPPTDDERKQVGYAVWQRAVRELQKGSSTHYTVTGFVQEDNIPTIEDMVYVSGMVHSLALNVNTGEWEPLTMFQINEWLKITHITINPISTERGVKVELELTNGEYADDYDPIAALYDKQESFDGNDNPAAGVPISVIQTVLTEVTHSNADAADCSSNTGKTYEFAIPSHDPSATRVFATIASVSPSANISYVTTQIAKLPSTSHKLCVHYSGGWGPPAPVTITVKFDFL